jgi:serine phosphatase RsbU (regulator of sigma subunit)
MVREPQPGEETDGSVSSGPSPAWHEEKNEWLIEKQKFEEKNKKLWQMSEKVHKERRQVDELNEQLVAAKEKLEADKKKLDEKVKKLWQQSTAIHKEKERINELKLEIEHKHQEILDSVNYAKRIQHALLASEKLLQQNLPEYFIFFKPKDIVSGDFYWASKLQDGTFAVAVADSTGHGVPGAIMSILNISCLKEAVNARDLIKPNEILDYTRSSIMEHMSNDGSAEGGKDGMDAVLARFDFSKNQLSFAAANNPVWLIRDNELIDYKPDKMPVGKPMGNIQPFTLHEVELKKNDLVIMITDGFADQFGGPSGKKYMYKPLKNLLLQLHHLPLQEISEKLRLHLDDWKGAHEQVDDVLIFGVRVS